MVTGMLALISLMEAAALVAVAGRLLHWRRGATVDALTGCLTRRAGEDLLATRRSRRVSLILLDLDGFKRVNDLHGHAAGDAYLRRAADTIRSACRKGDQVIRWGGDEFLVVLKDCDPHIAWEVAERLSWAMTEAGTPASVGSVAQETAVQAVVLADEAMYRVKAARRALLSAAPVNS